MKLEGIAEISVDGTNRLCVTPEARVFPFIYRAGTEVHWDEAGKFLYAPAPREWSYARWFQQIVAAVASEYDCSLVITPQTRWQDIDPSHQAAFSAATLASNI